eukprot:6143899-Amphidinium_carterae.1
MQSPVQRVQVQIEVRGRMTVIKLSLLKKIVEYSPAHKKLQFGLIFLGNSVRNFGFVQKCFPN